MLVLARKPEESIYIGSDVTVTVVSVKGDLVKIGVTAPVSTPVHREEVARRIEDQDPRKLVPSMSRHRDSETAYRNALHLVLARVGLRGDAGGQATFTASELRQIKQALAGGTEATR